MAIMISEKIIEKIDLTYMSIIVAPEVTEGPKVDSRDSRSGPTWKGHMKE